MNSKMNEGADEAKKLAEQWKNVSKELEKKITLMDLEGFARQAKEL
jgi:hypothetical protein